MSHDPDYAPAYAYAAAWHFFRVGQDWSPDPEADRAEAARLTAAAIERDRNDAVALAIHGHIRSFLGKDCKAGLEYLDRPLLAAPSHAMAWTLSSCSCGYLGDGPSAIARAQQGLRLSPLDAHLFFSQTVLGQAYYVSGLHEEAIAGPEKSARENREADCEPAAPGRGASCSREIVGGAQTRPKPSSECSPTSACGDMPTAARSLG